MVMGACPGQIPISCVPLTLMVTATVVRACRYTSSRLTKKRMRRNSKKKLVALFKMTEAIKGDRMNTAVFPIAAVALDAQPGTTSPTLALLIVLAEDLVSQNEKEPKLSYQTWHQLLTEPLNQVAERLGISFPVLL